MADLLSRPGDRRARLRALLEGGHHGPVVAPGAYDALSARLVEQAGFPVVYMTGFGSTASLVGRPDVGLLGGSEMADNARRLAAAVDVPLIADADTGYGNAINVIRTVREYEQAGVAGLHIEDQVSPKRCGHLAGKEVVPLGEMVAKIRAAVDARTDPNLVLIARTDAAQTLGLEAAVERARAFADAGADLLFVEAPTSDEALEIVATSLAGHRLVFNGAEGGRTPLPPLDRLRELGFALVLYPVSALLAAASGIREMLARLHADGSPAPALADLAGRPGGVAGLDSFTQVVGIEEIRALEDRYRTSADRS